MQNMGDLFGKLNEFQQKMQDVKDQLAEMEIEAEAGGGMVKVKANGNREIISIKVDKDVVDPEDTDMLEDLIVAGVNKALSQAEQESQNKMSEMTKGMMPGGIDPSSLGFK